MATAHKHSIDGANRQSGRLEAESRTLRVETDKLNAEHDKLVAEQCTSESERLKIDRDKTLSPWLLLAQGLIGEAALLGSSLALSKYLAA